MKALHISMAGPEYRLRDGEKVWRFEDHRYCGPIILRTDGEPMSNQPGEKSPVWPLINAWYQSGKPTRNGWAIVEMPQ